MKKIILLNILLVIFSFKILGQKTEGLDLTTDFQKINRAISFGVGHANVFDTYLSPQEYKGVDFRVSRESFRMTNRIKNVSIQNMIQTNISYTNNYINNNNSLSGLVNWNYGLHYQFLISPTFKILAGGLIDANLGFIYNMRNGNNPATAKAYLNIAGSGIAIWKTRIKKYPLILRYQLNIALAGMMFSPHYGQSYYEIFSVGNDKNTFSFTSIHNQPAFRQFITVDFPIRQVTLRCSYVCDIQQSKINHIKSHMYGHSFMIGFVHNLYKQRNRPVEAKNNHLNAY